MLMGGGGGGGLQRGVPTKAPREGVESESGNYEVESDSGHLKLFQFLAQKEQQSGHPLSLGGVRKEPEAFKQTILSQNS